MDLEGLKTAVRIGGIRGEAASEQALTQVLQRYAGGPSLAEEVSHVQNRKEENLCD